MSINTKDVKKMKSRIFLWVVVILFVLAGSITSVYFYKKHIAKENIINHVVKEGVDKEKINIEHFGYSWPKDNYFVLDFTITGDNPHATYTAATRGKKGYKVIITRSLDSGKITPNFSIKDYLNKQEELSGLKNINLKKLYNQGVKENKIDSKAISYEKWKKKNEDTFYPNFEKALKAGELPKDLQSYEKWIKVNVYGVFDRKDM